MTKQLQKKKGFKNISQIDNTPEPASNKSDIVEVLKKANKEKGITTSFVISPQNKAFLEARKQLTKRNNSAWLDEQLDQIRENSLSDPANEKLNVLYKIILDS